ncbi:hypothetical protein [Nocardioides perillae]|uniref:Uncharacterized protein n=1 Tax=Nocardioides perillae TaxID=1119534 RepID=A0A7Y9UM66_9ACTN|nr:hypothetical protein [Nocardioides perillae]NYG55091.1 hypothetical protein [Nocardioides perillae]
MPARLRRALPAGLLGPLLLVTGCSVGFPPTLGPTGIDGLAVPTPSPDPTSYAVGVDHPFLPLAPGARWELSDAAAGARLVVEVGGTREVAGIAATELIVTRAVPTTLDGAPARPVTAWLAEDDAGHVWLLAGEGDGRSWETGADGAEAGLLLSADPRRGDGYALWAEDGEPAATVRVGATDGSLAVPWGVADRTVELALDTDLARPGDELAVVLGEGVGPVAVADLVADDDLVLVERG